MKPSLGRNQREADGTNRYGCFFLDRAGAPRPNVDIAPSTVVSVNPKPDRYRATYGNSPVSSGNQPGLRLWPSGRPGFVAYCLFRRSASIAAREHDPRHDPLPIYLKTRRIWKTPSWARGSVGEDRLLITFYGSLSALACRRRRRYIPAPVCETGPGWACPAATACRCTSGPDGQARTRRRPKCPR